MGKDKAVQLAKNWYINCLECKGLALAWNNQHAKNRIAEKAARLYLNERNPEYSLIECQARAEHYGKSIGTKMRINNDRALFHFKDAAVTLREFRNLAIKIDIDDLKKQVREW